MSAASTGFNAGDRVRVIGSTTAGKIVSVGDTEAWLVDGETIDVRNVEGVKALIEVKNGPSAGKPWGYLHYSLDELEHID